jgi:SAM-dependent methyltransferase
MEYLKVIKLYYNKMMFLKIDFYLLLLYFFKNPFKISKHFLSQKGEKEIYTYGETPLTTLDLIANRCHICAQDTVYELGCGRGRSCFWLNQFIGCCVVGIDYVPQFIRLANKVKEKFKLHGVEFRLEDFIYADFSQASVIYLYGTCLPDHLILKMIEKFTMLPKGTKIITVSYSLNDYTSENSFKIVDTFQAKFTWGEAEVFLHIRR